MTERAGRLRWSSQQAPSALEAAAPVAGGWVFLSSAGQWYASREFLGALEPRGALELPARVALRGRGALVAIDGHGVAWRFDGSAPPQRLRALELGRVSSAVFTDAQRGAAVLEGGRLLRTEDAGARWTSVDSLEGPAQRVDFGPEGALVYTLQGRFRLDNGGALHSEAEPARAPEVLSGWVASLVARSPATASLLGVPVGDRVVVREGRGVLLFERSTGALRRALPEALPSAQCRLLPWGSSRVGAVCDRALLRSGTGPEGLGTFAVVAEGVSPPVALSDDGERYATRGAPCAEDEEHDTLCVARVGAEGGVATRLERYSAVAPLAMHGALVLLRTPRGLALLEEPGQAPRAVSLEPPALEGTRDLLRQADFASDGALRVWVQRGEEHLLGQGPPTGALTLSPLPRGARRARLGEGGLAFAWGETAGEVYRSLDGGRRFEAAPFAPLATRSRAWLLPSGRGVSREEGAYDSERFDFTGGWSAPCDARSCLVAGRVALGRAARAEAGTFPVAAVSPSPGIAEAPYARLEVTDFACAREDAQGPALELRLSPQATSQTLRLQGVVLRSALTREGAAQRVSLRWEGTQEGSAFRAESLPSLLPAATLEQEGGWGPPGPPELVRFSLLAASRSAVLLRTEPRSLMGRAAWLFARAGGPVRELSSLDAQLLDHRDGVPNLTRELLSAAAANGELVLLQRQDSARTRARVLRLDLDGAVRWRRDYLWSEPHTYALASRGGEVYLAVDDGPDPERLHLRSTAGEEGASLELLPPLRGQRVAPTQAPPFERVARRVLPVCAAPAEPGAPRLYLDLGEGDRSAMMQGVRFFGTTQRVTLELREAEGACLRAAESWWWRELDQLHMRLDPSTSSARGEAQPDGTLRAEVWSGEQRATYRCSPAPRDHSDPLGGAFL